ncbi:ATP-dependent helicase [Acholeplasma granularum]|uniref:ATP-dependent helicase n=1 Tax=Acholeplasma granularum TaxID=264635 RepID=UPI000472D78A|nr:UvrD-helicase domain-containing protein [Acholeplasma granularum]
MNNWLSKLNKEQHQAATHVNGPLFVVAGAGTGKTRTLTTRIAYLIESIGIPPENILAVTFTNKAAKEMKDRIVEMSGPYAVGTWVYTFHSFGVQLLRRDIEALNLGYTRNFNIIDEDDAKAIVRKVIKDLNLDSKEFKTNLIRHKISALKHLNIDYFDNTTERLINEKYTTELRNNNLLDFDDLQVLAYKLLKEHQSILEHYQRKFQYILVDEFQDTDHIQYQMMKLLADKHKNLFVVGDPDQSIYAFRGANYENANLFTKDFGGSQILDLNYRSTKQILNYANKLITHNKNRPIKKTLESAHGEGISPFMWTASSDFNESTMIANEIQSLVNESNYNYKDIAILYRNNALSRTFEDTLMKYNIPYVMYGGISYYQRREIKDILAYIRLVLDTSLDFYLIRVINVPKRAIGPTTLNKLELHAKSHNLSMFDAIDTLDVTGKTKNSLLEFKALILEMKQHLETMTNLDQVVGYIAQKSGYIAMLEEDKDEASTDRIENIKELKSPFVQAENYYEGTFKEKLMQLLDQIALYSDLDKASNEDAVVLSTFHQVKGLEFRVIFMTVMEEQIFPSAQSFMDFNELEEERRIAYVGVTRAKERLYLTRSEQRLLYGAMIYSRPSRFLKEMMPDNEILVGRSQTNISNQPKDSNYLKAGDKIIHQVFGKGIVVNVEKGIATIAFSMPHGIKQLMESHPSIKKEI